MISSGHMLTVLSLVFFLFMLLDSFYENRAPNQRMRGVSRLNTRLAFYTYEARKLRFCQTKALTLWASSPAAHSPQQQLYLFCWQSESSTVEYVFVR
jgi:hypothetical protein